MELANDITAFVTQSFAAAERAEAHSALCSARLHDGTEPNLRMLRCALVASHGNLSSLKRLVATLAIDWRDVIMAGEYERQGKESVRVRDLNGPLQSGA
jgi:hypothetical protein